MYTLNRKLITGTVKIRNMHEEKMREINREKLVSFLEEEKDKEKNPIRKQDYQILISCIMGIESLILEKECIKVIFKEENRWKGEAEAKITQNARLIQSIKNYSNRFKESTKVKIMSSLF